MAEQLSEVGKAVQGVAQEAFRATASRSGGGDISIMISCGRAVVRDILVAGSVTAITLGAIYAGYCVWSQKIAEAIKRSLDDEREDQQVVEIKPGCLHVLLRCFTDERYLQVLEDYESGIMKDRFLKEFTNIHIEVESLMVKIENWGEVQERKFAICRSKKMAINPNLEEPKPGMSNSSQKLFGVIVCDSKANWGGPEEFAKRVQKEFGPEDGQWKTYVAEEGQFPTEEELKKFQGFYITGSKHSVNDDTQTWIKQLELFIQRAHALKKPKVFGTCFGHQAISKALGGKVGKNPSMRFVCHNEKIKLCEDEIDSRFLNDLKKISEKKPFRMLEAHGECIEELPANAKSVASSESCKHEIVLFSDNIIGAQSHADYNIDDFTYIILPSLLESEIITPGEKYYALESFNQLNVGSDVAVVVRDFLNS